MTDRKPPRGRSAAIADDWMPPKKLERRAVRAMAASATGDPETAIRHAAYIADRWDRMGVLTACARWAETIRLLSSDLAGPGAHGFEMHANGQPVNPDSLGADMAGLVWASRFVAAWANRDSDAAGALVYRVDSDALLDGMACLLVMAGQAVSAAGGIR